MPASLLVGGTYRFQVSATLAGLPWDLTGGTATLRLVSPSGTVASFAGTIPPATPPAVAQVAQYDCLPGDLSVPGLWKRSWLLVLGSLSFPTEPVYFAVESPT